MTGRQLIPGRFYWAIPVLDVDAAEPWEGEPQPARFVGGDAWQWIAVEGAEWPARWVGQEITLTDIEVNLPGHDCDPGWNAAVRECRIAIESAGIKVKP